MACKTNEKSPEVSTFIKNGGVGHFHNTIWYLAKYRNVRYQLVTHDHVYRRRGVCTVGVRLDKKSPMVSTIMALAISTRSGGIGHVPILGTNETGVEDASLIIIGMSEWRVWNIGSRLT